MRIELAAHILARGKSLVPDRFPKPSGETARLWAGALGGVSLPAEVWPEAVDLWSVELVGDRMCTPKELIHAAKVVRDRWESDPEKRVLLDEHRVAVANRNYVAAGLEPVTVADLPQGHGSAVAHPVVAGRLGVLAAAWSAP